jgi:hypothetical protein
MNPKPEYKLVQASACEVGLLRDGQGLRTWFASEFDGVFPTIEHPIIKSAIEIDKMMACLKRSAELAPEKGDFS